MMSRTIPSLSQMVRSEESPSVQLVRMERELEMQVRHNVTTGALHSPDSRDS